MGLTNLIARKALKKAREVDARTEQITTDRDSAWLSWTPTITWTTAIPSGISVVSKYKTIGKTVFFKVTIRATNGNGATAVIITLPIVPKANNYNMWNFSFGGPSSSQSSRQINLRDDGVNNNLTTNNLGPATTGQTYFYTTSGEYEID